MAQRPSFFLTVERIGQLVRRHDNVGVAAVDGDEVALLLDYIEHCGDQLTGQKRVYYEKNKERDLAIVTLLLGTGIRVSECVGLDIEDVDFKNNGIKVTRKGGNEMVVYFGPEVEKALKRYLEVRENIIRWKAMNTLSSTLPSAAVSVSRRLRILSRNIPSRSRPPKRSHLTSSAAPTVRPCIRKQVIFTLLQMFLATRT